MKRLFVYGSLKKGFHNHGLLSNEKFVREDSIKGYDLYSLGSYPCIIKGNNVIKGEVYDVNDSIYKWITAMELGAGYYDDTIKTVKGLIVHCFIIKTLPSYAQNEIKDGIWK